MISRLQLSTLIAAVAIVWAVLLVLGGVAIGLDFLRPSILGVGLRCF